MGGIFPPIRTCRLDFTPSICYPASPIARLLPRERYIFAPGAAPPFGINQTKGT